MHRDDKELVVAEITEQLRASESLIVADYRGLTNSQLLAVRTKLRDHGATFTVVKNTLTRRAAEAAGADALLALLTGPTAIAFVRAEGDAVAVAKALADTAKETKILTLRGGLLSGKTMAAGDVEELAKLPPMDVLKGQVVGVILAPLNQLVGLLNAPLQDLVGLIDARIEQLQPGGAGEPEAAGAPAAETAGGGQDGDAAEAPEAVAETGPSAEAEPAEAASGDAAEEAGETAETTETTETTEEE
jgi:large subunit ribosomal protein L10